MKRLAIITTHPIQYNAPWFRLLAARNLVEIMVFYTWGESAAGAKYDPGFGKQVAWDIPLLDGYPFTFVKNIAPDPGSHHFKGIINPTLISEVTAWGPDALLVFGWSFHSHLACMRHFYKKLRIIFRGDSTLLDATGGLKKMLRQLFLRWVYRHIDTALYVGTANKAYFLAHGVGASKLRYAPHAIDNARFADTAQAYPEHAAQLRREAGVGENDLVILFAGKLEAKKNPLFLIKLLQALPDRRIRLMIAGTGELQHQIEQAAAADNRVILMGFRNQREMPALYHAADLFVLPSKGPGETWGLALNEAMACGRAVVASRKTGGAADLIENGINGLIIDPVDPGPLQQLVTAALADRGLLPKMGRRSFETIQSFSFESIVMAVEAVVTGEPQVNNA